MNLKFWKRKGKEDTGSTENTADNEKESTSKKSFRSPFSGLSERQKQKSYVVISIVVFTIIVIGIVRAQEMWQQHSKDNKEKAANVRNNTSTKKMSLLSERVEKDLWLAAEGQNIKAIAQGNDELRNEVTKLWTELEKAKKEAKLAPPTVVQKTPAVTAQKNPAIPVPPPPKGVTVEGAAKMPAEVGAQGQFPGLNKPHTPSIRIIEDENRNNSTEKAKNKKKKKDDSWLPTGSFMKVVLLNGIDAPTSGGAQSEPYPVLMSILDIATLPNRFRMDMRECFLIGAGYGNISDERAYIRTERLSCVRKNGEVADFDLTGHVIGEDGKLGMRGRLVSKQGQQIAMSIFAGTLGGLGNALKPTGTVKLDISDSTTTSVQRNDIGEVAASASLGGAGSALERVAQHYLKMAERMFPVIEVDAGRSVEIVILKGRSLAQADQQKNDVTEQRSNANDKQPKANQKGTPVNR